MSRGPDSEGAKELIDLARKIGVLEKNMPDLEEQARMAQVSYSRACTTLAELKRELKKHMDGMDCSSTGNYGWQGRIGWLLGEVIRQLDEEKNGGG